MGRGAYVGLEEGERVAQLVHPRGTVLPLWIHRLKIVRIVRNGYID